MTKEVYFQSEMFTGDLVDNRTRQQKKRARDLHQPRQVEMFSQREMAQFGVRARPKLPIAPKTHIELAIEDPRTDEEKKRDLRREIERRTYPLPGLGGETSKAISDNEPCQVNQND
jgi:hypothetical protein